ncbi:transcription elongation factor GreA [Patescibacteria group bacterium]|nr:transcription elongation factor GreA [Patescibacteria group bacterium]MCL5733436.1 transcription elongation factor GreA [Patescibacteria group bacterium]
MDKYYLTKARLDELKAELENLKSNKRIEVSEKIKRAKEFGDLSENVEYSEAKDEQMKVEMRIAELEDIIKKAAIIKKGGSTKSVQVGSTVTVKKNGQILKYTIVGSNETKPEEGKISNESPLGRAFLGAQVGDVREVFTPAGRTPYRIMKIE